MLGFGALGQFALGEPGPTPGASQPGPPGAGKRYQPPTDYLPPPAYEVELPRKKSIRPIWDRVAEAERWAKEAAKRQPEPEPTPPQPSLPPVLPQHIFVDPPPPLILRPSGQVFVPKNPPEFAQQMARALDESDAERATHAAVDEDDANDAIAALHAIAHMKDN